MIGHGVLAKADKSLSLRVFEGENYLTIETGSKESSLYPETLLINRDHSKKAMRAFTCANVLAHIKEDMKSQYTVPLLLVSAARIADLATRTPPWAASRIQGPQNSLTLYSWLSWCGSLYWHLASYFPFQVGTFFPA
jgi:hypothetical protein